MKTEWKRIELLWTLERLRRLFVWRRLINMILFFHDVPLREFRRIWGLYSTCQFMWWYSHYATRHGSSTSHWSDAYREQT